MTTLLQQAFDQAARLPAGEQDLLAARLLAELASKSEAPRAPPQAELLAALKRRSFVPPHGTPDSVELLRVDRA
jgi:hypothetical protein